MIKLLDNMHGYARKINRANFLISLSKATLVMLSTPCPLFPHILRTWKLSKPYLHFAENSEQAGITKKTATTIG